MVVMAMLQATGEIEVDWLTKLCNVIVKEGCILEDWKSSLLLSVYKEKFGFMPGVNITDAIFMVRQLLEKYRAKCKEVYFRFVDLEKTLMGYV